MKVNKQWIKRGVLATWLFLASENATYLFEIVLEQKYFRNTAVNIWKTLWKYPGMSINKTTVYFLYVMNTKKVCRKYIMYGYGFSHINIEGSFQYPWTSAR